MLATISQGAPRSFAARLGVALALSAPIIGASPTNLAFGTQRHDTGEWLAKPRSQFRRASDPSSYSQGILSGRCEHQRFDAVARPDDTPIEGAGWSSTLAGVIFGLALDSELDEKDRYCAGRTLDLSADGNNVEWSRPDKDLAYTFTPLRSFRSTGGLPCREFWAAVHNERLREQVIHVACRQPGGYWLIRR